MRVVPLLWACLCAIAAIPWISPVTTQAAEPRRVLRSASELDYPPFALVLPDGSAAGFTVDLLRAVTKAAHLEVIFEVGPWHVIKQQLADGEIDVLPFMSTSSERERIYDFSIPYLRMQGTIFVRQGNTDIDDESDLAGKEVIVMKGDTAHEYALSKKLSDKLILTDSYEEAMRLLSEGRHDAVVVQQLTGLQILNKLKITNIIDVATKREDSLKISPEPLAGFEQKFCIAVKKGNHELLSKLNEGLAIIIANGAFDALYTRWFGPLLPPKPIDAKVLVQYAFMIIVPAVLLMTFIGVLYLKRQVARKTAALRQEIEERKQAESSLKVTLAKAQRFQLMLDNVPVYIYIKDLEYRYIYANRLTLELFGCTDEEIIGRDDTHFFPPDSAKRLREVDSRVLGGLKTTEEIDIVDISGNRQVYLEVKTPLYEDGENGKIFGLCGVSQNITARKQAEEELWRTTEFLNSLIAYANAPIIVWNPDMTITTFNKASERLTGWGASEIVGRGLELLFPPDQIGPIMDYIRRTANAGERWETVEIPILHLDGSVKTVSWNSAGIVDPESGRLVATIAQGQDITERIGMERELRESRARLEAALASIVDAVFISDDKGRFIDFNEAFATFHKFANKEECSREFAEYPDILDVFGIDGEPAPVHEWAVSRALRGETATNAEYILRRKDTGESWVGSYSFGPIRDKDGAIVGSVVVGRDITKRNKVERQLMETNRNLEEAKRRAEEFAEKASLASKAKSEFLANMSHEIRTPMNGILGMLQLLRTTEPTPEQDEYLLTAIKSCNRLTRLLSDILDLSQIESGKLSINASPFRPAGLKETLTELFAVAAREKKLDFDFVIDENLPPELVGDENRLLQILFNLVGNAIKFTEKGSVRVEAARLPDFGNATVHVLFTVRDTGIGIRDEQLNAIFEPFTQAEGSYTRRFQGAGLGLSIVRKLVSVMGGGLAIDNARENGATIYLSLPFGLPEARPEPRDREGRTRPVQTGAGLAVLIAEDDEVSLQTATRMLEKSGCRVTAARDGQEALALLRERDVDLILMDVQMPVMDGVEATRTIRGATALGPKSRVPIIAMTAYAMAGDKETFLAAGMDGYVAKPVDMKELMAVMDRVLAAKDRQAA